MIVPSMYIGVYGPILAEVKELGDPVQQIILIIITLHNKRIMVDTPLF